MSSGKLREGARFSSFKDSFEMDSIAFSPSVTTPLFSLNLGQLTSGSLQDSFAEPVRDVLPNSRAVEIRVPK